MFPPSMSKNEDNYAAALTILKVDFDQQVPLGVIGARGSQFIDLVAYVPPKKVAIFIQGKYWHTTATAEEDQLKQSAATHAGYRVVLALEEDTMTVQDCIAHARREVL